MSQNNNTDISDSEKKKEDWMNSQWRPMMGWMYMAVCIFDFIIFPILWSIVQSVDPQGSVTNAWSPLTIQGAGLFHMAMGAVLGIAVFGRTQEKLAIANNSVVAPSTVPPTSPSVSSTSVGGKAAPVPAHQPEL